MLKYFIMLNIFISSLSINAKTIIFDLHGVLLDRCPTKTGYHIGYLNYASYSVSSATRGFSLEQRCQDFLMTLEQHELKDAKFKDQPLPKIIGQWLRGEKTADELVKEINSCVDKSKDFFKSELEEKMIRSVIDLMLPDNLAFVVKPVNDMVRLVQECKMQKDRDGKPKHNLLILSNWDKESFPLIKKNCKKLFKHFDEKNIVISSEVKLLKPETEIFQHVIKKFNLDPKDCIFIDDQKENTKAAEGARIADVIQHRNYEDTRQKLIDLKVIDDKSNKLKIKTKISFKNLFE